MIALVALVTFWAYVAHCAVVPASHTTLAHLGAGLSVPPQVIPGPGLPSLASLGLTNELLFDPEFQARMRAKFPDTQLAARSKLSKRFDPKCMRYPAGNTRGADACAAYLRSLDTTPCVATQDPVIMCAANVGGTVTNIGGFSIPGRAASYCRDAATGVQWSRDHCAYCPEGGDCWVAGWAAAGGNGDLIIVTTGCRDEP